MQTVAQFKKLLEGSIDIGFTRTPNRFPNELTGFIINRQPLYLVLYEGHPLTARKKITPDMLVDEPFVAASLEMEVGFWSNIASITPPGLSLRIVKRAPDVFTVLALVAAGIGISVLSKSLTRIAMPGLVYREIAGVKRTSDHVAAYRKNESAPVVQAFVEFLRAKKPARADDRRRTR